MKIFLATLAGIVVSMVVNMAIVMLGMAMNPAMDMNMDMTNSEQFMEAMKSFRPVDYMFPLAAHVLGLLSGLLVGRAICKTSKIPIYIIFGVHMLGTIMNLATLPHPTWFAVVDVALPVLITIPFLRNTKK